MVFGVKIGRVGMKNMIDPVGAAISEVGGEGLGVVLEVFGAVELEGIDKDGGDHGALWSHRLACFFKEADVPAMERPHGGNEGHRGRPVGALFQELGSGLRGLHG